MELKMVDLGNYSQHKITVVSGSKSASGTSPYIADLLSAAGVQSGATKVTFTSADLTKEVTLSGLNGAYSGGIRAINSYGTLWNFLPGASSGMWVKNLVRITVIVTPEFF